MNKIVEKEYFSDKVVRLVVENPKIARSRKAGNFVILKIGEKGERFPLTIAGADPVKGTITLVVQIVGVSSAKLAALEVGESIDDLVGPLGKPTDIELKGTILACGGGVGVAPLLPIVEAFKKAGNRVVSVIAARSKDLIILEEQIRQWSDEVIVMTDDGSYGRKGLITAGMEEVIQREKIDECIVIGPCHHDEICLLNNQEICHSDPGQPQFNHGGWNRNVRCMQGYCWRKDQVYLCRRTGVRRA